MVHKTKKAEISTIVGEGIVMSVGGTLHWNSNYEIMGKTYKVSTLVKKGLKSKNPDTVQLSKKIERDTKSKGGLVIGFPMAFLVRDLQREGSL